jgi:hypothetical protein
VRDKKATVLEKSIQKLQKNRMIGRKGHEISLDFQKNSKNIIFYLTDS